MYGKIYSAARYCAAPRTIPENLWNDYTANGKIFNLTNYYDDRYLGSTALEPVWTVKMIHEYRKKVQMRVQAFNYDNEPMYQFFDKNPDIVKGKRCLVIGSENPWAESMLLEFGALKITTLEFGTIKSEHPQISTILPQKFTEDFLLGKIDPFDFVFSYSSIEHDGLGRYGDVLNPNGDLHMMAKLLDITKPGGYVAVGIPCCHDRLEWNAHRVYGTVRLAMLFSGYQIVGVHPTILNLSNSYDKEYIAGTGYTQPLFLLKNIYGCSHKRFRILE